MTGGGTAAGLVALVGCPGCGKTTQARLLAAHLGSDGVAVLSVPGLFRSDVAAAQLLPAELRTVAEARPRFLAQRRHGRLAPLELDRVLFGLAVRLYGRQLFVILDGAPRGPAQVMVARDILADRFTDLQVVHLDPGARLASWSLWRQARRSAAQVGWRATLARLPTMARKYHTFATETRAGLRLLDDLGVPVRRVPAARPVHEVTAAVLAAIRA